MKKWIKKILGITKLEQDLKSTRSKINSLEDKNRNQGKEIAKLNSLVRIGADLSFSATRDESWMVICIKGRPEYVQFIDLRGKEQRRVIDFLRQFEGRGQTIDAPMGISARFRDLY